jgi:predicted DNA-binding protein (UPF0251 family)
MREDVVEMRKRELERWQVIQRVILGALTQAEAGEVLGLCERQVRRLVKEGKKKGARGLIHGSWGKPSPRKMAEELEERIAAIIRTRYPDFSPLHASEKLFERHRIGVSREKVRQVMMAHGLWKRRRMRKEAHLWRERKHHVGEMAEALRLEKDPVPYFEAPVGMAVIEESDSDVIISCIQKPKPPKPPKSKHHLNPHR